MTESPDDPQSDRDRRIRAAREQLERAILEADVQAKRDRLALSPSRAWVQDHDGKTSVVQVDYHRHYPQIVVRIEPAGSGLVVRGWFRENGTLRLIEVEATADDEEVTAADLRNLATVRTLKAWEVVGRELARQVVETGTLFPQVDVTTGPTEALRSLTKNAAKDASHRKRGPAVEERLRLVVDAYRDAIASGDPHPRKTVALKFGYSSEHIGRLLGQARKPRDGRPPLLGPAAPGRAGEEGARVGKRLRQELKDGSADARQFSQEALDALQEIENRTASSTSNSGTDMPHTE